MTYTSSWRSPSNIALIKYWGKQDTQIPRNPSLSLTLSACHTDMSIEVNPGDSFDLSVFYEGNPKPEFKTKIIAFFKRIEAHLPWIKSASIRIDSHNTFPHGAGIASSASAMSALALGLKEIDDQLRGNTLVDDSWWHHVSELARLGSGSASRSVYKTASLWGKLETVPESSDQFAIPWHAHVDAFYASFQDTILIVNSGEKSVSSTAGHQLMELHPHAAARYRTAKENLLALLGALQDPALVDHFIAICESEALQLHALMMSGANPFLLLEPATIAVIKEVWRFRQESGLPVCFTLDAGPNVHLLYPAMYRNAIFDWIKSDLQPYCSAGRYILDHVGHGPEKLN